MTGYQMEARARARMRAKMAFYAVSNYIKFSGSQLNRSVTRTIVIHKPQP